MLRVSAGRNIRIPGEHRRRCNCHFCCKILLSNPCGGRKKTALMRVASRRERRDSFDTSYRHFTAAGDAKANSSDPAFLSTRCPARVAF